MKKTNLDNKKAIVIGVNKFIGKESNVEKKTPDFEEDRQEIIKKFKSTRNEKDVSNALLLLEEKAKTNENLIPYIIDCSDHKCTLGEISASLKKVFGEYSL